RGAARADSKPLRPCLEPMPGGWPRMQARSVLKSHPSSNARSQRMGHDLMTRKKFSVEEFEQMGSLGLFDEDSRLELIDGDIVTMPPIGSLHASCVDRLFRLFLLRAERTGRAAVVRAQNPIRLAARSEPQPDLSVAKARPDFYKAAHPTAEDLLL